MALMLESGSCQKAPLGSVSDGFFFFFFYIYLALHTPGLYPYSLLTGLDAKLRDLMKLTRATLKGKKETNLCLAFDEIPALTGYGALTWCCRIFLQWLCSWEVEIPV